MGLDREVIIKEIIINKRDHSRVTRKTSADGRELWKWCDSSQLPCVRTRGPGFHSPCFSPSLHSAAFGKGT